MFRFASLQSEAAGNLLEEYGLTENVPDSIVLFEENQVFYQSTAALKVARRLKWPWPLLYGLIIVPKFIRDSIYNYIARKRYKWFGQREQCFIPSKDMNHKFLD